MADNLREQMQEYTDTTAAYIAGEDVIPGDCWRACLASLLEISREEVPHFAHLYPSDTSWEWWYATLAWIDKTRPGYTLRFFDRPEGEWVTPSLPEGSPDRVILSGPSPRGPWKHGVLVWADNGKLAHDPFPSNAGVEDGPGTVFALVKKEADNG